MTRRKKIITAALMILLGGLSWLGYIVWTYTYITVPNGYAAWNAAALINEFIDTHDGAWPQNWDDLRQTYNASPNRQQGLPMDDIQARVAIDWHIDTRSLAASPVPLHVLWLNDGRRVAFGVNPDEFIWQHQQKRNGKPASKL